MGMLNAASSTVGLIPSSLSFLPGYNSVSLRSSDDSMTVFSAAPGVEYLASFIVHNKKLLKLLGISLSLEKTLYFSEGNGEYNSMFQDDEFFGSAGVETSSLRPGGHNPQEDFNQVASHNKVLLREYTINIMGAFCRISIGIENVRRLWRTPQVIREMIKDVSIDVIFLSDGGRCPWNLLNLDLDEASLRYTKICNVRDNEYFYCVMNPNNPFSHTLEEKIMYSKETGAIEITNYQSPLNIFTYVRRSNRTINNLTSKLETASEKSLKELYDICTLIDPALIIKKPASYFISK